MVIGGDADHEDVGAHILGPAIDTEVLITTRIMDLNLYLLFLDIFGALVDVKYCRLVILRERIVEIVTDQARFTNGGVADEHYFDFLYFVRNWSYRRRLLNLFFLFLLLLCLLCLLW